MNVLIFYKVVKDLWGWSLFLVHGLGIPKVNFRCAVHQGGSRVGKSKKTWKLVLCVDMASFEGN